MLKVYIGVLTVAVAVMAFMQASPTLGIGARAVASLVYAVGIGVLWGGLISSPRWLRPKKWRQGRYSDGFFEAWSVVITLAAVFHLATLATGDVPFKVAATKVQTSAQAVNPEPDDARGRVHQEHD